MGRRELHGPGVSVKVDEALYERLQAEAQRRDVSIAYLIRHALDRQLPVWEAQELP